VSTLELILLVSIRFAREMTIRVLVRMLFVSGLKVWGSVSMCFRKGQALHGRNRRSRTSGTMHCLGKSTPEKYNPLGKDPKSLMLPVRIGVARHCAARYNSTTAWTPCEASLTEFLRPLGQSKQFIQTGTKLPPWPSSPSQLPPFLPLCFRSSFGVGLLPAWAALPPHSLSSGHPVEDAALRQRKTKSCQTSPRAAERLDIPHKQSGKTLERKRAQLSRRCSMAIF
jgi:hypothetical protein